jgi:serine O-acetyltransferase
MSERTNSRPTSVGRSGAVASHGEPALSNDVLEGVLQALTATSGDALSKAAAEGFPDREEAVAWAERVIGLVLHQRDRSMLRAELPVLAEQLAGILRDLTLPAGFEARAMVDRFFERLPAVRALLAEDVEAAFDGDPAATSYAEIAAAYPALGAIASYRLAHELCRLGVPLLPRLLAEQAHARTGIDIHPGAKIGRRFFIDHGTGVVIGETAEIGDRCVIYQGVTLGALAPRKGQLLRGVKRHPTLEDDVTIYAGATILGGETVIGRGSVIGGNVWLTHSTPACSKVQIEPPRLQVERDGACQERSDQLIWDI